jgi:hypothetical protein
MVIFVLVLLTGMGLSLLFLTANELTMSRADERDKQSFAMAEAGVEDGRMTLFATNGGGSFDDDLVAAFGANGVLDFDPDALTATRDASGNVTALGGFGDDQPVRPLKTFGAAQGAPGWYAAFLTNDPTEDDETTDTNDRVMMTSVGLGSEGSMEIVQAIIEQRFLTPPLPPAAITLLGPDPSFQGGNSGAKAYSGNDCDGLGDPSIRVPTVGVIGSDAKDNVTSNLGKAGTYRSGSHTGADTIADLTDPTESLVPGALDPTWTNCMELRAMMAEMRRSADVICTNASCVLPPATPDRIVFVEGNYTAGDGKGVLAVTKKLQVHGNWDWEGLVLVVGTGEMRRAGGGNGTIFGGIIIANIAGPDFTLFTDDDCTDGTNGFDSALYSTSGGGNSTLSYCQAALDAVKVPLPYRIVDFRQR